VDIRALLAAELERRRQRNSRYSLRAFARSMGFHHSTLSRILRRRQRVTARMADALGRRLGLARRDVAEACAYGSGRRILNLVGHPDFRPQSRWLAVMAGIPLDDVNLVLQRLLQSGRLAMVNRVTWTRKEA
jgi:transcriptional regulator with XRE-family HTH domain